MAVRITNSTTNRTYLKNLNGSQHAMNTAMERVESGRDFQKVSENVTKATRAISVRARLYRNEQMTDNVNTAAEQLTIAESSLKQIGDICSNVQSEMFKAMSSMNLQASKETFSSFLDGAKDEIMRLANTKYNDKYILGGSGVDIAPFKANENGMMECCGAEMFTIQDKAQMISSIKADNAVGTMSDSEASSVIADIQSDVENYYYANGKPVDKSGDSYMDIGLDISVSVKGKVAQKTAFKTTVDGIGALGYGTTDVPYDEIKGLQASAGATGTGNGKTYEKVSNNIYDMMTQMQDAINSLEDDSMNGSAMAEVIDKISAVMVNFKKQTDKIIAAESELGVRSKFLETNLDRLENENTSLKKMQKDLEGVDDATEITSFMSYQNAWNLVLQFGKNIVPKSLMDYVN